MSGMPGKERFHGRLCQCMHVEHRSNIMRKNIFNKILVFSSALFGLFVFSKAVWADETDAMIPDSEFKSWEELNEAPKWGSSFGYQEVYIKGNKKEDIGIGENVQLVAVGTDVRGSGHQDKMYVGDSGTIYSVYVKPDGSYKINKEEGDSLTVVKEGKDGYFESAGLSDEQIDYLKYTFGTGNKLGRGTGNMDIRTSVNGGSVVGVVSGTETSLTREYVSATTGVNFNNPTNKNQQNLEPATEENLESIEQASDMQVTYEIDTADNEADLSEDTSEGAASSLEGKQMTTTVTTNKNGEVSTQTSTKDVLGGSAGATASGDTAATSTSTATQTSADTQKAEENKQEEKKKEDTEQYDGLYNGMHIIPDIMAMHCKIKGEDVAQNPDLFVECIKQYVSEMNNPNATAKAEAEREYEMLKYKVLTDAGSTAITKSAVVNNHERATNDTVNAQSNLPTESDDNKGIMASLMFVTNMMNDVRELMVEQLKYNVISGIGDIDPAIVMQQDEAENKAEEEKTASGGENKGPEYTAGTVKVEIGDKK